MAYFSVFVTNAAFVDSQAHAYLATKPRLVVVRGVNIRAILATFLRKSISIGLLDSIMQAHVSFLSFLNVYTGLPFLPLFLNRGVLQPRMNNAVALVAYLHDVIGRIWPRLGERSNVMPHQRANLAATSALGVGYESASWPSSRSLRFWERSPCRSFAQVG